MAVGVYISCEDPFVADAVSDALSRSNECFPAASLDAADVVLAEASCVPERLGTALVVLASGDPIADARFAIARGADGIATWPDDPASLARVLHEAAARRAPVARGRVIAVAGARGGAGATTIAAHLAAGFAPGALLLDSRGGAAGQALFVAADDAVTLADVPQLSREPSMHALASMAAAHASGVRCVLGGSSPPPVGQSLIDCARGMEAVVVCDGDVQGADVTVLVCGPDVGSVRRAAEMIGGRTDSVVVLNRAMRGGVRPREVRRALGVRRVHVVPADRRLARAVDLGRIARRGSGARAIGRLARELEPA